MKNALFSLAESPTKSSHNDISYIKSKKTPHHYLSGHKKLFKRFVIIILSSTDLQEHGDYVTYPQHVIITRRKCSKSI